MSLSTILQTENMIFLAKAISGFLYPIFNSFFNFFLYITIAVSAIYFIITFYMLFSRKKAQPSYEFDETKAPFVTIQIPTFNELAALQCARKCLDFDYPKSKFEIIIGDDSNDTEISGKISLFAQQHEDLIKITRRGSNVGFKPGNLNHMLKFSKGEIIVIFDSDFTPEKDFLKRIIAPFMHDKSIKAVQARWNSNNARQNIVAVLGSTIISVCHMIMLPFIYKKRNMAFLCGSAEAVRKDLLIELGTWKTGSLTEDIDYTLKLLKNSHKVIYLDSLECEGEVPYRARDLYKQQMRWAYGVITAFKDHGKDILLSKKLTIGDKLCAYLDISGYMISFLLICLFITGFLSFVTHKPETVAVSKILFDLGTNILLTSGLIVTSIAAQSMSKNARTIPSIIISFFSYGLVVVYYVNKGIVKALFNRPMYWFMLKKNANAVQ